MAILELYKKKPGKDATNKLVIRFAVNRKTYRYDTGIALTQAQWDAEQKTGYTRTKPAVELEQKAKAVLQNKDLLSDFSMDKFRGLMTQRLLSDEPFQKWWAKYEIHRKNKNLAPRTLGLDKSLKFHLDSFLADHPEHDDITLWDPDILSAFYTHMRASLSATSGEIYMEQLRTFFGWLHNDIEILPRHPFRKYSIPQSSENWHPFSTEELKKILNLKPKTDQERTALAWVKLILMSGGSDPADFANLKWKRVSPETITVVRTKVQKESKDNVKVLHLIDQLKECFDRLAMPRGDRDDYVFGIYEKGLTEAQNQEKLKALMKRVNYAMQQMLKDSGVDFTIKRLRPSGATIANNTTKDLNFVKYILGHSNITQTDTYLKRTPSDVVKGNQLKYEEALRLLMEDE